jgi:hypothetical protein
MVSLQSSHPFVPGSVFFLLVMMVADDLARRLAIPARAINVAAFGLTAIIVTQAIAGQLSGKVDQSEENFDGAVRFLHQRVTPSDLVLVHACCKEGFDLYANMDGWQMPPVIYGETGWPCCARGKDARPGRSTKKAALQDLDSKMPRGLTGRVWLFYTTRPTHWAYVGLDEGNLWRNHLWDRGCPPGPYFDFGNLTVSPMNCAGAR